MVGLVRAGTVFYEHPGQGNSEVALQDEIVFILEETDRFVRVERSYSHYWVAQNDIVRCNPWKEQR
jgi:hypothetical protein